MFPSTATITLQCTVCSSLQLQPHYSAQGVPLFNHTPVTARVVPRSRNLQLRVWPNCLLDNIPTSFIT